MKGEGEEEDRGLRIEREYIIQEPLRFEGVFEL